MSALAPTGRLRAAINTGNPVLARAGRDGGAPEGVSVELARRLGRQLGLPVDLVVYGSARVVNEALDEDAWDVAFMAADPARAARVAFTPPYVAIEASYVVRAGSPFQLCADLDRPGLRVAAGDKAAYDLHLTRTLRHAAIERAPDQGAALRLFDEGGLDAGAGVRQALDAFAAGRPELRVLRDSFLAIGQCMAVPRTRGAEAASSVGDFLAELKASGELGDVLERHGQSALAAPT